MDLDELIAAERAEPQRATLGQAGQVWQAIERSMVSAVPPTVPLPTSGAEASLLSKVGAALSTAVGKTVVATTLIAAGAAGATQLSAEPEPAHTSTHAAQNEAVASPTGPELPRPPADAAPPPMPAEPEEEPVVFEETPPAPHHSAVSDEPGRPRPPRPQTRPAPRPAPASSLSDELRLIQEAQQALSRDQPRQALAALAEHRSSFPDGSMREDREALRVVALCKRGDADRDAAARAFRRRWPRSLFSQRIETACK